MELCAGPAAAERSLLAGGARGAAPRTWAAPRARGPAPGTAGALAGTRPPLASLTALAQVGALCGTCRCAGHVPLLGVRRGPSGVEALGPGEEGRGMPERGCRAGWVC
eukprot:1682041-Rhodomonas_salina.1